MQVYTRNNECYQFDQLHDIFFFWGGGGDLCFFEIQNCRFVVNVLELSSSIYVKNVNVLARYMDNLRSVWMSVCVIIECLRC